MNAAYTGAHHLLDDCHLNDPTALGYPAVAEGSVPAIVATNENDEPMVKGRDFAITRILDASNTELTGLPTQPGYYTAVIEGIGDYTGTIERGYTVVEPVPAVQMTSGETVTIAKEGQDTYWLGSYTAPETGRYAFVSVGNNGAYGWSAAVLANEGLSDVLASGNIYYDDIDYHVNLQEGQTVYYKVWIHGDGSNTGDCSVQVYPEYDLANCRFEGTTVFQRDVEEGYTYNVDWAFYDDAHGISGEDIGWRISYESEDGTALDEHPTQPGSYRFVFEGIDPYYGTKRVPFSIVDGSSAQELEFNQAVEVAHTASNVWIGVLTAPEYGSYTVEVDGAGAVDCAFYRNEELSSSIRERDLKVADGGPGYQATCELSEGDKAYIVLKGHEGAGMSHTVTVKRGVSIAVADPEVDSRLLVFTDEPKAPTVSFEYSYCDLVEETDYELVGYVDGNLNEQAGAPSALGSYYAVYRGLGDYVGKCYVPFSIVDPHDLSAAKITLDKDYYASDGGPIQVEVAVADALGNELTCNEDYTLRFFDNDNDEYLDGVPTAPGAYFAVVDGIVDYTGTIRSFFAVYDAYDLQYANAQQVRTPEADGNPASGFVNIVDALDNVLVEGEHYRAVSYVDRNTWSELDGAPSEVGRYRVTYEGINPYHGVINFDFEIIAPIASIDLAIGASEPVGFDRYIIGVFTAPTDGRYTFYSTPKSIDAYGELFANAELTELLAKDDDSGEKLDFKIERDLVSGQTVYLRVSKSGGGTVYEDSGLRINVRAENDITGMQWSNGATAFTYDGRPHVPAPACSKDGENLTADKDFALAYVCAADGTHLEGTPSDCGSYQALYEGIDPYTGTHAIDFTINPATATVHAQNASKTYGEPDPELTATVDGLVGNDTVAYSLTRAQGEDVGSYAITATGEEAQGNYLVSFEGARFEISKAAGALAASAANDQLAVTYNAAKAMATAANVAVRGACATPTFANASSGAVAKGFKVDASSGAVTLPAGTPVGVYEVVIEASDAGDANHKAASATVSYKIVVKEPVKAANPLVANAAKATLSATYNPSKATVTANNVVAVKAQGALTYANASTNATAKKFIVAASGANAGTVTIPAGTKAGTYAVTIKVTAAGNASYLKGSATVAYKITVGKAANTLTAKAASKKASAKTLKKKAVKVARPLTVKNAKGKVTYAKASGASCLTINKTTGEVTVKKGTKKGSYSIKVKVTAAGNANYKSVTKSVSCKIVVK